MTLQKANKNNATAFKFVTSGDTLKGYYQGQTTKTINGSPAVEHTYKTNNGLVSVLGQANILNQLKNNNVSVGTYVEISFTGQAQKLKGGRTMKVYDVSFDRDDIDTDAALASGSYDDDGIDDESEDSAEDTAAYVPPTPPKTPASPLDAQRQARVRDLLKNRSTQS